MQIIHVIAGEFPRVVIMAHPVTLGPSDCGKFSLDYPNG
jgi:hypothetical protein